MVRPSLHCIGSGFTLIELIVVITLLGILTLIATSRFSGPEPFASMAAQDQLIAAARFAQQTAMNRGPNTNVTLEIGANSYQLLVDGTAILLPGGESSATLPSGATVTAATIDYDSLGNATGGAVTLTVSVSGEADRAVTIEGSGYAH